MGTSSVKTESTIQFRDKSLVQFMLLSLYLAAMSDDGQEGHSAMALMLESRNVSWDSVISGFSVEMLKI